MLKAVAMVTSNPRITAPLCLATERKKARQRLGETVDVGRRGRLVSCRAIRPQRRSPEISRTTESSAEVFRSVRTQIPECYIFTFNVNKRSFKQEVAKNLTEALASLPQRLTCSVKNQCFENHSVECIVKYACMPSTYALYSLDYEMY